MLFRGLNSLLIPQLQGRRRIREHRDSSPEQLRRQGGQLLGGVVQPGARSRTRTQTDQGDRHQRFRFVVAAVSSVN